MCYLRHCALLCGVVLYSISNINSTQINNAEYVYVVMSMYDLIKHSDIYSKESGVLWQSYRDEPNANTAESEPFKSKIKKIGKTPDTDNDKKNFQKCSSNFLRTLEIRLTNCEISVPVTWSKKCVIYPAVGKTGFAITDTKLYVPVLTLSTQDF